MRGFGKNVKHCTEYNYFSVAKIRSNLKGERENIKHMELRSYFQLHSFLDPDILILSSLYARSSPVMLYSNYNILLFYNP